MAKVITTELQHSGASGANITLDSSKNVTCENNLTVDGTTTLTGAVELPDDTVDIADLSATGTASSSTFLRGDNAWAAVAAGGITHIDTWVITTSFTGDANPLTANWARSTTSLMSQLGTGVTESSGVFTMPATGHWLIIFRCHVYISADNDEKEYEGGIRISTDSGTTKTLEAENKYNIRDFGVTAHGSTLTTYIADITNTSTQKISFDVRTHNSNTGTGGHTDYDATYARFIRLADT